MIRAAFLVLALAAGTAAAEPSYRIDTTRYVADATAEAAGRAALLARVDAFAAAPQPPATPAALLALLRNDDALRRDLHRHAIVAHLRAAEDTGDHAAAAADDALGGALDKLDAALGLSVARLGRPTAERFLAAEPALRPYRQVLESTLRLPVVAAADERAVETLAQPALASLANAYGDLRRAAVRRAAGASAPADPEARFRAKWAPFLADEAAFAALLAPIGTLQEGAARLQGFADAADAAYARAGLSTDAVQGALRAARGSDAWARYSAVVTAAAARRLQVAPQAVRPWDRDAADAWQPPRIAFPDALPLVLAADRRAGPEIAGQFERLLDPANGRVEWCRAPACDDSGFSVGTTGVASGLFYGAFDGSTDSLRAVAHEAGHAVHRQFMSEHQPIAACNDGPKFMFESFAIFNELLFLDHLQRSAPSRAAAAFYLRRFLDDATFQVFGSAAETDLEQALHADIRAGGGRTAAELDARTLAVLAAWMPPALRIDDLRASWARNKLYFIDPFYDVNYLFAGLLALAYLRQFELDPADFARRYVALQENGFDDTPAALLERFMGIALDDPSRLVSDASALIEARTATLERLYAPCTDAGACPP